jgi:predicted component of type VI protein secretion system
MNTILNSCHDLQKKQVVMQDTQLDKLLAFKELLQAQKASLSNSKFFLFMLVQITFELMCK